MGIGSSIGKAIGRSVINTAIDTGTSAVINKAMTGNLKMPNLNVKMGNGGDISLPYGLDSYISKPVKEVASKLSLSIPTEINGVKLPSLPDLTQVAGNVESALNSIGLSSDLLGIRSINDILSNPDLNALKAVEFASPVDLNNMPDVNNIMKDVNVSELQNIDTNIMDIDSLSSKLPVDISKFF